ncbi:hypothetical protein Q7P37_000850 [Cladosporium fusiforme]
MAIGRLYYYTVNILALGFCCISHYHMWPEKGYTPHRNVGNKFRKDPKEPKEKRRKERKKRDSDERRHHKHDDDLEEPEWIADFNTKRKAGDKHEEDIPASAAAQEAGRPRRVSFEDERRPDLRGKQGGNTSTGYVPYDYIYGTGAANTTGVSGTVSAKPPPSGNGLPDRHASTARSSNPTLPFQAQMELSAQGLGLSMGCDQTSLATNNNDLEIQHAATLSSQESNLRKRRLEASPEKFNTGQFEPLQPQSLISTKRSRANDGTPRAAAAPDSVPRPSQLTAVLSNFNINRDPNKQASSVVLEDALATGLRIQQTPRLDSTQGSQLTAGLEGLNFTTPKASSLPRHGLPPTPQKTPKKKPFSLISAFCSNNELLLLLTGYLTIPSLISLYSISKEYHHQINCHYTAHMLAITRTWAPKSENIFPWRCYKRLCVKDPRLRQKSRLRGKENEVVRKYDDLRDVPSIRWLQMVVYRHGVCKDILIQLATHGHRFPPGTLMTLKRLWFILDLPTSTARILVIHSREYMCNAALHILTMLFLKIDMHFTDPEGRLWPANHPDPYHYPPQLANKAFVGCSLRKTLFAERSLTPLWRLLRGWSPDPRAPAAPPSRLDMVRLWVRHYYEPDEELREDTEDMQIKAKRLSILDVPPHEIGTAQLERVGQPHTLVDEGALREILKHEGTKMGEVLRQALTPFRTVNPSVREERAKLIRIDQLVMRESVKRELGMAEFWVKMLVWGWHDGVGRRLPILTEEEMLRLDKGLPLLPRKPRAAQHAGGGKAGGEEESEKASGKEERKKGSG